MMPPSMPQAQPNEETSAIVEADASRGSIDS